MKNADCLDVVAHSAQDEPAATPESRKLRISVRGFVYTLSRTTMTEVEKSV